MSEDYQEYDDYYYNYDDGRFADNGGDEEHDDFDIPTYDELDIEGRYYTYGSREEYNAWRYQEIQALRKASRPKATSIPRTKPKNQVNKRLKANERHAPYTKTFDELPKMEKADDGSHEMKYVIMWISIIVCIIVYLIIIFA